MCIDLLTVVLKQCGQKLLNTGLVRIKDHIRYSSKKMFSADPYFISNVPCSTLCYEADASLSCSSLFLAAVSNLLIKSYTEYSKSLLLSRSSCLVILNRPNCVFNIPIDLVHLSFFQVTSHPEPVSQSMSLQQAPQPQYSIPERDKQLLFSDFEDLSASFRSLYKSVFEQSFNQPSK